MGKNIYETPRDQYKWHTGQDSHDKKPVNQKNERLSRLEKLKSRYKKEKEGQK
jgi:flagellar motility protein MotE (MotC chaperone)